MNSALDVPAGPIHRLEFVWPAAILPSPWISPHGPPHVGIRSRGENLRGTRCQHSLSDGGLRCCRLNRSTVVVPTPVVCLCEVNVPICSKREGWLLVRDIHGRCSGDLNGQATACLAQRRQHRFVTDLTARAFQRLPCASDLSLLFAPVLSEPIRINVLVLGSFPEATALDQLPRRKAVYLWHVCIAPVSAAEAQAAQHRPG